MNKIHNTAIDEYKRIVKERNDRELVYLKKREDIMIDALSEIKASYEGESGQDIGDIIEGCIEELRQINL